MRAWSAHCRRDRFLAISNASGGWRACGALRRRAGVLGAC